MPTDKDYFARFSELDNFIKRYPQEKLYAVLNVNRKPFSEISIDDLGLGTKALNPLLRHDKIAIKDVLSLSVKELLRFRGLGVKSVKEIITQLLFYFREHPELVSPCNAEDEAQMQAEEETTFALEYRGQLSGAMHFIPEDVKERSVLPLLRAYEASAFGKTAPAIRAFIAESCLQVKVCEFPQYVEQMEVGKHFAERVMAAGAFMDWLKDHTKCSVESALQSFQKHLDKRSPKRWELLKLRADGVALDEAARRLGITTQKAAQTEQTALELFHGTYIREETDLVMMVYALKLGHPLLLTDELAAYIGETASLLRFACRQGMQFPCFSYDENDDAFLILADEWEYKAFEQSRDAIRRSLPFRFWLEETGALAQNEIEQCVAALLKAEGLAKSNDLAHHALFDCQREEPLLTIIDLWTLDAFHELDRESKGRYAKIYFPLLAKHYTGSDKHATRQLLRNKEQTAMEDMRRILEVFENYLQEDKVLELIWTKHGVTVGLWSEKQNDWEEFTNCPDAKTLCRELCNNMATYRQEKLMQKKGRDLTAKEMREIYQSVRLCWEECGFDPQELSLFTENDD